MVYRSINGSYVGILCFHDLALTYNNDAIDYCFHCYKFAWRILIIDIMQVVPNPYNAPSMFSLGSGKAAAGGFCGSLPANQ